MLSSNCARSTQTKQFPRICSTCIQIKEPQPLNRKSNNPHPQKKKKSKFSQKQQKNSCIRKKQPNFHDRIFNSQINNTQIFFPQKRNRIFRSKNKIAYNPPQFCSRISEIQPEGETELTNNLPRAIMIRSHRETRREKKTTTKKPKFKTSDMQQNLSHRLTSWKNNIRTTIRGTKPQSSYNVSD